MRNVILSLSTFFLMSGLCFAQSGAQPTGAGGGSLKSCPKSPNCVSSQASDPEHSVAPLAYFGNRADAYARLKKVLTEMKRTAIVAEREDYLHVEARSLIFRFVDDVEFYFPVDANIIHVRSASRVGNSDMGVNRKRVEEIRKRFAG
jgi:uncharacterized protein (DUF1499 family)